MKLSIVTTSFQSSSTIVTFIERVYAAAKQLAISYELIIVEDGSTDESKQKIIQSLPTYKNMKLIELSRNFGHHQAILVGLEQARGEYVFLIDSDLEEAPELVALFYSEILTSKVDVVYGISDKYGEGKSNQILSDLFWRLFRKYTKLKIPKGICTVRMMTREYVNSLLLHKEVNVFLAGLWETTGFIQKPLKVSKIYKGTTHYTFGKRFDLALTSLISFSGRPLRLIAVIGAATVLLALLMLFVLLIQQFIVEDSSQGWLSIITLIILVGGIQILSIGMVAIYVASILDEVKARPRAIIANIWPKENKTNCEI
jgi:putative glycosyltransferase